jgi:hypothetical protein
MTTPDPIERVRAGLHALAAETGLRLSAIRALAVAEADEADEHREEILEAVERGESMSAICGRWHVTRLVVERIVAEEGR